MPKNPSDPSEETSRIDRKKYERIEGPRDAFHRSLLKNGRQKVIYNGSDLSSFLQPLPKIRRRFWIPEAHEKMIRLEGWRNFDEPYWRKFTKVYLTVDITQLETKSQVFSHVSWPAVNDFSQ